MKFHLPPAASAIIFAIGITASGAFAQDAAYDADTVLAEVNGSTVTLGHVIAMRMRLPEQYQNLPPDVLYSGILDQLIDQIVLSDHVKAQGDYDDRAVKLIMENERRGIIATSLVEKFLAEPLPEDSVKLAYDSQIGNTPSEQEFNASHILVETEEEAKALVEALAGGADFAELAKEKSTGPSGPGGGSLGWFGKGQMVPAFEAAVTELEVDQVSAPVQTQFGWHVIKMNEKRDKPKPALEAVQGQISEQLAQEQLQKRLDVIREGATITRSDVKVPPNAMLETTLIGR